MAENVLADPKLEFATILAAVASEMRSPPVGFRMTVIRAESVMVAERVPIPTSTAVTM